MGSYFSRELTLEEKRERIQKQGDNFAEFIKNGSSPMLINYENMNLGDAIQDLITNFGVSHQSSDGWNKLIKAFSAKYSEQNGPLNADSVYMLVFSVLMLNQDIRQGMPTDRDTFIKNLHGDLYNPLVTDEILGQLYDRYIKNPLKYY
jgi:hypothetical protein